LIDLGGQDRALLDLLRVLKARDYAFITPTPLTHARVVARRAHANDLRDALGWSLPFREETLAPEIVALLREGGVLSETGGMLKSEVRISRLGPHLLLHSAFPTLARDSVFFGPDSYRFAAFVQRATQGAAPKRIADIGAGAGAGAIVAAALFPAAETVLTDINPRALRFARINAAAAELSVSCIETDTLAGAPGAFDLILANPPYIIDAEKRAYRDGGALHGGQVSLDWTKAALARLTQGGRFLLYTGAAIVGGQNELATELARAAADAHCAVDLQEIDPDVFGEELESAAYSDVERIAVIGAVFTR
jgi:SAM-dependent methyltransferase